MRDRSRTTMALAVTLGALLAATVLSPLDAVAADADYAFRIGGSLGDSGRAIAVDGTGTAYVAGDFAATVDLEPGPLNQITTEQGSGDVFVGSYNAAGRLRWAFGLGGNLQDDTFDIAVRGTSVYVVGAFAGTVDFDPGPALMRRKSKGGLDGFVLRLHRDTGAFLWLGTIGGPGEDTINAVAVDAAGRMVLTGHFSQTADLDPSGGVFSRTSAGLGDLFVSKLEANGTLIWARRVGGAGAEDGSNIGSDASGKVFVAGSFASTVDFDPGTGVQARTSNGAADVFVLALAPGGAFIRVAAFGGPSTDNPGGIGVTSTGAAYVTGHFQSTVDFDPGPGTQNRTAVGIFDVFVLRLQANGALGWVATAGSTGFDFGNELRIGAGGRIYTTGSFAGTTDFDPSAASFVLVPAGGSNPDVFVWVLAASGAFVDAWRMGGTSPDLGIGIDVLGPSVYTTGTLEGSGDFDPGAGTLTLTSAGSGDVFVSRVTE